MNTLKRMRVAWVVVALLVALGSRSAQATPSYVLPCGKWSIVPSPNPSTAFNFLNSVAAVSASDVWAVGRQANPGSNIQPLIEHWTGKRWQAVTSPAGGSILFGVAAVSASDVWAVGTSLAGLSLIEHWDGAQWRILPSPNAGRADSLQSVAVLSAHDIWAAGYYSGRSGPLAQNLIEHWDGHRWSLVPSPNVGTQLNELNGVSAISSTDVWAVGVYTKGRYGSFGLTEHWDGSKWRVVSSPNPVYSGLNGVAALSQTQSWAVGYAGDATLSERWTGSHWHVVPSGSGVLTSVAARNTTDLWSVGFYQSTLEQTLTEHWDGTRWQSVSSPNVASVDNYLTGVAVVSPHSVWAVGYYSAPDRSSSNTLIEYYC